MIWFLFLLLTIHFRFQTLASSTPENNVTKPKPLELNLIHGGGILPKKLKARGYVDDDDDDDIPLELHRSNPGLLFVSVSIGEPPLPQLLVMDTGSTIMWVLCYPCLKCVIKLPTLFHRPRSSTYRTLACDSHRCTSSLHCDPWKPCLFQKGYAQGLFAAGLQATEQVTIGLPDGVVKTVPDVLMGCAIICSESDMEDSRFNGMLGLGNHNDSLLTMLGSKFSLCLGNLADPNYRYSNLRIGSAIELEGDQTPMTADGKYQVYLGSITVGGERLDIRSHWTILDTGTLKTWLPRRYYDVIESKLKNSLVEQGFSDIFVSNKTGIPKLCFWGRTGNMDKDFQGFPLLRLQFAYGGAVLELDPSSLFIKGQWPRSYCLAMNSNHLNDETIIGCLAMNSNHLNDETIIGLMAMQYYNLGFDINRSTLYVQKVDCQYYEDDE